jgi:glucose-6-phosphate isomerase
MTPHVLTTDPTSTAAWAQLGELAQTVGKTTIRELTAGDRGWLRMEAAEIQLDASRQRVNGEVMHSLFALARECGVERLRDQMFSGVHINTTEDRAVLHTALRAPSTAGFRDGESDASQLVATTLHRMEQFAASVRQGEILGASGKSFTDVVNIGIGGSDLGPAMAYQALAPFSDQNISCHFVSNVDPADIHQTLMGLDPASTLFIVASKTFTTSETMTNAGVARDWLVGALGENAVSSHFVALSTNASAVAEFGVTEDCTFGFWDWVGGRYSMDSAIGLSTMIAVGPAAFLEMLDGFRAMDVHFQTAAEEVNLPMLMGLLAVWNRNFLGIDTTAVLPYSHVLARFPAYLQQLTMESNGKSVRRDGSPVTYATGGIVWGEPGTNGQHSFYQLLHQGTSTVAVDEIIVARSEYPDQVQQDMLVANALAQASVLSMGRTLDEVRESGTPLPQALHKVMPGDRPTTILMMRRLDPFTLGSLIALYEHSVFVQGAIWGINSFDQWGVELGKIVAVGIFEAIESGQVSDGKLDGPTQASIKDYLELK